MVSNIICIVGMWTLMGALFAWREETSNNTLYNILEYAISLPWVVLAVAFVIISYPFLLVWKFIRNAVRPVTQTAWDKAKIERYWKFGNFRLCFDKKARAFCNKLFLVRIANPSTQIKHDPVVIVHNEPSVPPGEFRTNTES